MTADLKLHNQNSRTLWLDYLKSFITVLVIAHHASLAYTTFAWFDSTAYIQSTAPIVDNKRWIGMDVFENFNDIFFMFLMFFIGGIFLVKSMEKKGMATFLKDRVKRLFIPFLFLGTPLMLLAYFPAYYTAYGKLSLSCYLADFFTVESWPPGPPWFIGILFVFNLILGITYPFLKPVFQRWSNSICYFTNRPITLFTVLFCITFTFYVPFAYFLGEGKWVSFGPLDFQLSRLAAYFCYFLLGAVAGMSDFENHIFSLHSRLVVQWKYFLLLSLVFYSALTYHNITDILGQFVDNGSMPELAAWMIYYTLYVGSCTASCIGFTGMFRALVKKSCPLWNSLSQNAYLIYLLHYIFVVWIQFFLLQCEVSAGLKFMIVFVLSLSASWIFSIWLRKINLFRRFL
jgi:hypothetical protein